jgi:hypothetical protein
MNRTNFEHLGYALLMQVAVGLLTGDWLAGAMLGAGFFIGREHAQVQRNDNVGDFRAFDLRIWTLDNRLDAILPCLGVALVAWLSERLTLDYKLVATIQGWL